MVVYIITTITSVILILYPITTSRHQHLKSEPNTSTQLNSTQVIPCNIFRRVVRLCDIAIRESTPPVYCPPPLGPPNPLDSHRPHTLDQNYETFRLENISQKQFFERQHH